MNRTALLTALTATAAMALTAPAMATAPANDDVGSAFTIAAAPKTYNLTSASTQTGEKTLPGSALDTAWYKWTAPGTGAAYASVCGAAGGTHLVQVFKLPFNAPATIANLKDAGDDWTGNPVESTPCRFRFNASKGQTYYVQLDRTKDAAYEHELKVVQDTTPPPAPVLDTIGPVTSPTVKPTFTVSGDTVATMCSIDMVTTKACQSGEAITGLKSGKTGLILIAVDTMGNLSPWAVQVWDVDGQAPTTAIGPSPDVTTVGAPPRFTFAVADDRPEASSSECRVDGGQWAPCASPFQAPSLPAGKHTLAIRSTDAVGNVEVAPKERTWITLPPEEVKPPEVVEPRSSVLPKPCTLSLKAPKSVKRKALKRGLKKAIRLTVATTGPCSAKVAMKRRGGKVRVTVTAGSLIRTASVKVR